MDLLSPVRVPLLFAPLPPPPPLLPVGGFPGNVFSRGRSMSVLSMAPPFESATSEQLAEIIREAEGYLQAQLQAGIAADQRAMVYAGFLAAAVIALAGGAVSAFANENLRPFMWVALLVAAGFMWALHLATRAARPVDFCYVGNTPAQWEIDIRGGRKLDHSLGDMARHYDEHIEANRRILRENCRLLSKSMEMATRSLAVGAIGFAAVLISKAF